MRAPLYTLIAYRPNFSKYLGCGEYQAGSNSELSVESYSTAAYEDPENALVGSMADYLAYNRKLTQEATDEPFSLSLLIDGAPDSEDGSLLEGQALEERRALRQRLQQSAQEKAEERLQPWYAAQRRRAEEQAAQEQEARALQETRDRAELARLTAQYGPL